MVYNENSSDANIEMIEHSVINRTPDYPTISGIAAMKLFEKTQKQNIEKKSKLAEQIKNKQISDSNFKSQWLVTEGLLILLRDTLLVLPDTMSSQVLCHVVKPELLLVMANHPATPVRTAVVKVLAAFLQRSSDEELNKFTKNRYFYHLANQLSLFTASRDLANACGVLITRCTASLEEQMELTSWNDLNSVQLGAIPPILALLPKSIHDLTLTREILTFITNIFTRVSIFNIGFKIF